MYKKYTLTPLNPLPLNWDSLYTQGTFPLTDVVSFEETGENCVVLMPPSFQGSLGKPFYLIGDEKNTNTIAINTYNNLPLYVLNPNETCMVFLASREEDYRFVKIDNSKALAQASFLKGFGLSSSDGRLSTVCNGVHQIFDDFNTDYTVVKSDLSSLLVGSTSADTLLHLPVKTLEPGFIFHFNNLGASNGCGAVTVKVLGSGFINNQPSLTLIPSACNTFIFDGVNWWTSQSVNSNNVKKDIYYFDLSLQTSGLTLTQDQLNCGTLFFYSSSGVLNQDVFIDFPVKSGNWNIINAVTDDTYEIILRPSGAKQSVSVFSESQVIVAISSVPGALEPSIQVVGQELPAAQNDNDLITWSNKQGWTPSGLENVINGSLLCMLNGKWSVIKPGKESDTLKMVSGTPTWAS